MTGPGLFDPELRAWADRCRDTGDQPDPLFHLNTGPRIGGLFEGYGGLTMGVRAALGGELAWYSEYEPPSERTPNPTQAAARLLEHHHPHAPNHGDITTVRWADVEPVDVLTGGWPCQPWSLAGTRKGAADDRALWPFVAGAVRALRPRLVVLENVAAIVAAGELARAVGDLAGLGYVGCWVRLRAADVGAPHGRARIFICAAAADAADLGYERGRSARVGRHGPADGGDAAPDPDRVGVRQQPVPVTGGGGAAVAGLAGEAAADAGRDGCERGEERDVRPEAGQPASLRRDADGRVLDWGIYDAAIRRWERILGRPVPAPTVLNSAGNPQLSPYLDEWLMGLPEGHVTGVPGLTVREMLRLCGNGVVPLQAEVATRWGCSRLGLAGSERAA